MSIIVGIHFVRFSDDDDEWMKKEAILICWFYGYDDDDDDLQQEKNETLSLHSTNQCVSVATKFTYCDHKIIYQNLWFSFYGNSKKVYRLWLTFFLSAFIDTWIVKL